MSATDYILIFDNLKIIHFDVVFSIFLLLINVCFRMFFELKHSCSSRIYLENILKLTAGDRFKFLLRTPRIYFQGGWGVAFILMGGAVVYYGNSKSCKPAYFLEIKTISWKSKLFLY